MVLDKDEVQSAKAAGPMTEKRGTVLCFLPGKNLEQVFERYSRLITFLLNMTLLVILLIYLTQNIETECLRILLKKISTCFTCF